jgi:hypothetical protein
MKSFETGLNVLLKDNNGVNKMSASARRTLELFYIRLLVVTEFRKDIETNLNENKTKINEFKRK